MNLNMVFVPLLMLRVDAVNADHDVFLGMRHDCNEAAASAKVSRYVREHFLFMVAWSWRIFEQLGRGTEL